MNFSWHTNLLYPLYTRGGPHQKHSDSGGSPFYYDDAFLAIQDRISNFFIRTSCEYAECEFSDAMPEIRIQRFPYPPYVDDALLPGLEMVVGLFIMLSFVYPMIVTVQFIAVEKEKQLKDVMTIMGMPVWLHSTCWFCNTMMFLLISISCITVMLKVMHNIWLIVVII